MIPRLLTMWFKADNGLKHIRNTYKQLNLFKVFSIECKPDATKKIQQKYIFIETNNHFI